MSKIIENTIYSCSFCGNNYGELETAEKHLDECLFNYEDNQTCYTCENCTLVKEAPFGDNTNKYLSQGVVKYIGVYDWFKCQKTGEKITEEELYDLHRECYDKFENTEMNVEETAKYVEYTALLEKAIEEEESFGEYFMTEGYKEVKKVD